MSRSTRDIPSRQPHHSTQLFLTWGAVALVVVIVAVLVIVKITGGNGPTSSSHQAVIPAPANLVQEISKVPASVFNVVGVGIPAQFAGTAPIVISGQPKLTLNGRTPSMLYYGAEYCPFCAAERWSIAVALARFGQWNGLQTTASGLMDGDYSTFTFSKSMLTSSYLNFAAIEACTNIIDPNAVGCSGYSHLQSPTTDERAVLEKYAGSQFVPGNTQGISFPYIDVDNRVLFSGSTYQPVVLTGLTQAEIASGLRDPTNPVTQSIIGTANYLTAAVCSGTSGLPTTVCSSSGVTAAARTLRINLPGE